MFYFRNRHLIRNTSKESLDLALSTEVELHLLKSSKQIKNDCINCIRLIHLMILNTLLSFVYSVIDTFNCYLYLVPTIISICNRIRLKVVFSISTFHLDLDLPINLDLRQRFLDLGKPIFKKTYI